MKRLVRVICILLCVTAAALMGGCFSSNLAKEKPAYNAALTSLFAALDSGDADAVYELFSPAVREADPNLKEQIERLTEAYSGPTDEIGWNGLLRGDYSSGDNGQVYEASTEFPVRSGDTYYWFYVSLMYINTADESMVGITKLHFFTADEYCIQYEEFENGEGTWEFSDFGIEIFDERKTNSEIKCIYGRALRYSPDTAVLDIEKVKEFFAESNSFDEFKAMFGEPNAEYIYYYYGLPSENGEPRYLQICDNWDGTVCGASVVDDFVFIENIYSEDE